MIYCECYHEIKLPNFGRINDEDTMSIEGYSQLPLYTDGIALAI